MNAKTVELAEFTHEMQPYGWVKIKDCVVETRTNQEVDYNNGRKLKDVTRTYVRGTVIASSWCGALWCGVPVSKPRTDRYPVGSSYECRIKHESDLERGATVDVAM
jgi:hypothetical protein